MKLPASYGRFEQEYCILRELGSGGEGKVYLVRHQVTEQLRAAKRLWKGTDADRLHELKMMKRLRHPSLPEVIDVLPEKDCIWLIMTYVKGQCLQELFGGGISEMEFFSIAGQLSEVLGYLHGRRMPILHLDIKPTNLLLKRNGRLVLIDFGAALQGQPGIRPGAMLRDTWFCGAGAVSEGKLSGCKDRCIRSRSCAVLSVIRHNCGRRT